MSVLRIFCPPAAAPERCAWRLLGDTAAVQSGQGALARVPRGATRVQLVLAASDVLLTRVRLPTTGRRPSSALLAYAMEDQLASNPDGNQVRRLGQVDGDEVLVAIQRQQVQRWCDALAAVGVTVDGVYGETLMLPWQDGEWSLAWDGREGFVRTGRLEGGALDCGDATTPPLALQLLLDAARARDAVPAAITLHVDAPVAQPDLGAWTRHLGIDVRLASAVDWRASAAAGIRIDDARRRWHPAPATLAHWRHVGGILLVALALHSGALLADHVRLSSGQHRLQAQMETRFRGLFPTAVAVADPVLQTRRQLAQARHVANRPDAGDFPVMLGKVSSALSGVPAAQLRVLAYADGRMTLEFAAVPGQLADQIKARLMQTGLTVEVAPPVGRAQRARLTLTLRAP